LEALDKSAGFWLKGKPYPGLKRIRNFAGGHGHPQTLLKVGVGGEINNTADLAN
jgi:hypothetical protein